MTSEYVPASNKVDDRQQFEPFYDIPPELTGHLTLKDYLKETVDAHPSTVYSRQFIRRVGDVIAGAKSDLARSEHRGSDIAWGIGTVITQVIDRFRITTIVAPEAAILALENTDNNSLAAGAAAAGVFALWNYYATGETLTQTMDRFPQGEKEFKENFPVIVDLFTDSLPGIVDKKENDVTGEIALEEKSFAHRCLKNVGVHIRRAFAGFSLGSTAFVATSSVRGENKNEVRKHNARVTADTSGLIFIIGFGVSKYVNHLIDEGQLERAQDVMNFIDNNWVWYTIAGVSLGSELVNTRIRKKKLINKQIDHGSEAAE